MNTGGDRVPDRVEVGCYAGGRGEETPRVVLLGGHEATVRVERRWLEEPVGSGGRGGRPGVQGRVGGGGAWRAAGAGGAGRIGRRRAPPDVPGPVGGWPPLPPGAGAGWLVDRLLTALGGKGRRMSPDEARAFGASNRGAVLITRRSGGGLQTSPVLVGVDDEGKVVISTREGAYKTRNLRRDPRAVLCVRSRAFFVPWIQLEGTAEIVSLPEAMEGLVDYYRRISGAHPHWDACRRAMQKQRR